MVGRPAVPEIPWSFAIGGVARPPWVLGPVVLFSVSPEEEAPEGARRRRRKRWTKRCTKEEAIEQHERKKTWKEGLIAIENEWKEHVRRRNVEERKFWEKEEARWEAAKVEEIDNRRFWEK